jgi:hypothetical protein
MSVSVSMCVLQEPHQACFISMVRAPNACEAARVCHHCLTLSARIDALRKSSNTVYQLGSVVPCSPTSCGHGRPSSVPSTELVGADVNAHLSAWEPGTPPSHPFPRMLSACFPSVPCNTHHVVAGCHCCRCVPACWSTVFPRNRASYVVLAIPGSGDH